MIRKITISLVAIAAVAVTALPTDVSARGRGGYHGSYRGGYYGGYRGGLGYRPYYYAGAYGYSCWRWQVTPWGSRRVWVCGNGYPYY